MTVVNCWLAFWQATNKSKIDWLIDWLSLAGRLDGPSSSTLRSLARFNSGGHSSETEGVDGEIMDAVIRTATASLDRRPLRDRRRPSPASSASSRDSVERQKCQLSSVFIPFDCFLPNANVLFFFPVSLIYSFACQCKYTKEQKNTDQELM